MFNKKQFYKSEITYRSPSIKPQETWCSFAVAVVGVPPKPAVDPPVLSLLVKAPVFELHGPHQPFLSKTLRVVMRFSGLTCGVLEIHTFVISVSSSPLSFPLPFLVCRQPFLYPFPVV